MSTPFNPLPPEQPQLSQELAPQAAQTVIAGSPAVAHRVSVENPPWTLLDVSLLVVIFIVTLVVLMSISPFVIATTHLFGYNPNLFHDQKEMQRFWNDLRVGLAVQLASYLLLLLVMVRLVHARAHMEQGFFRNLRWCWPHTAWPAFLLGGAILEIVVTALSAKLPIPPSLPIERLFQTQLYAYLLSGFSILVAPFFEELFFRGFLYPALARPLGMGWAVILTSLAFMLVHGVQLSFSWAPLLLLLLVGVVLSLVRAYTKAFAPGVLVHVGYNTTLVAISFFSTGGFRHLEKM